MPWKLIGLVVLLVLVAAFATLNLSNRTDISIGLHVFKDVPIFLSLLVAFLAGLVVMLPFSVGRSRRGRQPRAFSVDRQGRRAGGRRLAAEEPADAFPEEPPLETAESTAEPAARERGKSAGSRKTKAK